MKVGDYVRTVGGFIGKVISKKGNCTTYRIPNMQEDDVLEIIKSSPNIIDLIEIGDYVNGLKVIDILENDIYISDYYAESYIGLVKVKDIKSIVTHEQFERMQYNLES